MKLNDLFEKKYYEMELDHDSRESAEELLSRAGFEPEKENSASFKSPDTGEYAKITSSGKVHSIVFYDRSGKVLSK